MFAPAVRPVPGTGQPPGRRPMKVLTVYAHPSPKSFCHAILQQFTKGLEDSGHISEVVDLYAIRFDPVFHMQDFASYVHENMPLGILEQMNLKQRVLDSAGGPIQRFLASIWLRNKDTLAIAKFIHDHRPKDVIAQWEKVKSAQGLAFIAPVYWLHFRHSRTGRKTFALSGSSEYGLLSSAPLTVNEVVTTAVQ
jgi:NAD(P)H dehydrogenase (quinone)